jgi:L-ribulose-5-phosphate 4-epimerase
MKTIQQQLLDLALYLQASGLNEGSSGNCSIRDRDGFYITPSGINPKAMSIDDMVFMDFNGTIESSQKPPREPSSEWRFHHDILKTRKDANVVIHTHSTFATTLSLFRKDIPAAFRDPRPACLATLPVALDSEGFGVPSDGEETGVDTADLVSGETFFAA